MAGYRTSIICAALCAGLGACASVKVPLPSLGGGEVSAGPITQHTALSEAAERLSRAVPQAAEDAKKGGLHRVVFGGRDDAERAAASAYLLGLGEDASAARVLADADAVLSAGRDLAVAGLLEPGDAASDADVDLLEAAIGEVQRSRRLLTTAMTLLREAGEPLTKSEVRELGDAFVQAARDIGTAADLAAARADEGAPRYADRPGAGTQGY